MRTTNPDDDRPSNMGAGGGGGGGRIGPNVGGSGSSGVAFGTTRPTPMADDQLRIKALELAIELSSQGTSPTESAEIVGNAQAFMTFIKGNA